MQQVEPLTEDELNEVYNWVDEIPLSRPKKNISRDFSDGVLMAEIIHYYMPRVIDIHNYNQSHSTPDKAFRKLGFQIASEDIDDVVNARPGGIERILKIVRSKIQKSLQRQRENPAAASPLKRKSKASPKSQRQVTNGVDSEQKSAQDSGIKGVQTDQDNTIEELRGTAEILAMKVEKLEQLIDLKEGKIQVLQEKLKQIGL